MTTIVPVCMNCVHYDGPDGEQQVCAAFPQGIPLKILHGESDHTKPMRGDHGVQFEADDDDLELAYNPDQPRGPDGRWGDGGGGYTNIAREKANSLREEAYSHRSAGDETLARHLERRAAQADKAADRADAMRMRAQRGVEKAGLKPERAADGKSMVVKQSLKNTIKALVKVGWNKVSDALMQYKDTLVELHAEAKSITRITMKFLDELDI